MTTSDQTRRRFLLGAGAVASGLALAGCSAAPGDTTPTDGGGGGGGGEPTATPTSTESSGGDSGDSGSWTKTSTVEMTTGLAFEPKRIQVTTGTTVTWKNVGSIGHTVTAYEDEIPDGAKYFASGGFDSEKAARNGYTNGQKGNIPKGETYEHTFETAGTYKYYCIPHEMNGMVGFVKVV